MKGQISTNRLYKKTYSFYLYVNEHAKMEIPPIIRMYQTMLCREDIGFTHLLVRQSTGRFYPPILSVKRPDKVGREELAEAVLRDFSKWFDTLPPQDYSKAIS